MFLLLFSPVWIPIVIVIIIKTLQYQRDKEEYENSAYFQSTQLPYSVAREKGPHGEYLAYKTLERYNNLPDTKFLFNIYLPTGGGHTTEIDIVMISSVGIFVIENKDFSGWIFGNESHKQWCQTLPARRRRSQKNFFYNPIMQNRSHIKHLKAVIGNDIPVYSVVSFSDRCTFKDVQTTSDDVFVIYQSDLPDVVWRVKMRNTTNCLSETEIAMLYNQLFPYSQVGESTKEQHKMNIHQMQYRENMRNFTNGVDDQGRLKCPKCSGHLVVRTARRGVGAGKSFYGCSRYPECKYTRNIE